MKNILYIHKHQCLYDGWGEIYTVTVKCKYEQLMIQEHRYQTYPVAKKKKTEAKQGGEKRKEEKKEKKKMVEFAFTVRRSL